MLIPKCIVIYDRNGYLCSNITTSHNIYFCLTGSLKDMYDNIWVQYTNVHQVFYNTIQSCNFSLKEFFA